MAIIKISPALASQEITNSLLQASTNLALKDPTIWGEKVRHDATHRLDWVDLSQRSRALLPALDAIWVWARERNFKQIILSAMGGSSLAAKVIAQAFGKELLILDSTDPDQVKNALEHDLRESLLIISSKSGETIEVLAHWAIFEEAFKRAGINPTEQIIIITDPSSPMDQRGSADGYRVFHGNPNVGGRFSALTAFGLVPAALLGIDVSLLLDDADEALTQISKSDSPAIKLAQFLAPYNFFSIKDSNNLLPSLDLWIEQLISESTGKNGKGILPLLTNNFNLDLPTIDLSQDLVAPLGAQFIVWEWATALLGVLLKVNPFDQPDVESAKSETLKSLTLATLGLHPFTPEEIVEKLDIFSKKEWFSYISLQVYLNQLSDGKIQQLAPLLEQRYQKPVSFGWGPGYLHATGQFHKGGPRGGLFIQITGEPQDNIVIPGRGFGLQQLILAQADGDARALTEKKNPVYRVHLSKRKAGIDDLLKIFAS